MRSARLAVVTTAALLVAMALAPVALAAAPANDLFANATVASIGFSESVDTTEATTDADDAQLNANCGAPATDASVWYAIVGTDQNVLVDVSGSDYSAGILVGTGTQGNLSIENCGPGAVAFFAASGTTYYVLAIDDQTSGDGLNGGNLSIAFSATVSPSVSLTVDRYGTVNAKTGVATISGSYACENGDFIDVFVDASQSVGRFIVRGFGEFFDVGTCDGTSRRWSAQVFGDNGRFAGGKTMTVSFATSCGAVECADGYQEQTVMLRGTKK